MGRFFRSTVYLCAGRADMNLSVMTPELRQAIENCSSQPVAACAISAESADGSIGETEGLLFALARAVEQRDCQTAGHCERMAAISVALGMALGLGRASLLTLYR